MSYTPVIPTTGLTGWRFLQSTYDRQMQGFRNAPVQKRDVAYFQNNIQSVSSAEQLVSDRRLLKVALGAFGLQDDINSRAFIRTILESDPSDTKSLVNRITDQRYKDLANAFDFSSGLGPKTTRAGFAGAMIARYETKEFEISVGEISQDMRLALSAKRELTELATQSSTDDTKWYKALGRPPLRRFLETALGLPRGFGQIDLDQQLGELKSKSKRNFGIESFDDFSKPKVIEAVVQRFQLLTQFNTLNQMSSASIALQLLL